MIDVVYFSSVSGQTAKFIGKLGLSKTYRLPLRKNDDELLVTAPYVLITPTYGAGKPHRAVPPQVIRFLNNKSNRDLIRGVVAGGNRNYGSYFCYSAEVISSRCNVPILGRFEITGLPGEAEEIKKRIDSIG